MKTLYMDIQQPGVQQILYAKQGDTYSRFFKAVLLDGGIDYSIPQGSELSMWFSGTVPGWYDQITEKDGVTKHSAFSVNGNEVTVELAEQMMANVGTVSACLMLNTASGVQISMWSIIIEVESVPGIDSSEVSAYIEVLTGKVAETLSNANAASASASSASASATAAAQSAADAQAVTQGQKGYFETDTALKAAHPIGQVGWWAIVGSTDTIWVWDDTTSTWLNSGNQTDLSNYYTKTQADAEFPAGTIVLESEDPTLVPLNADTLGGQASNYYCKAADVGDVSNLTTTAKTIVPAVNELNQNLAVSVATVGNLELIRSNGIVTAVCNAYIDIAESVIPEGYRPAATKHVTCYVNSGGSSYASIRADGHVYIGPTTTQTGLIVFSAVWRAAQ